MQNQVKSEQWFAVTRAKWVAVFQASLKVVRQEAGAQLFNIDNKHLRSQGSKHLWEGGCCEQKWGINLEIIGWLEAL